MRVSGHTYHLLPSFPQPPIIPSFNLDLYGPCPVFPFPPLPVAKRYSSSEKPYTLLAFSRAFMLASRVACALRAHTYPSFATFRLTFSSWLSNARTSLNVLAPRAISASEFAAWAAWQSKTIETSTLSVLLSVLFFHRFPCVLML